MYQHSTLTVDETHSISFFTLSFLLYRVNPLEAGGAASAIGSKPRPLKQTFRRKYTYLFKGREEIYRSTHFRSYITHLPSYASKIPYVCFVSIIEHVSNNTMNTMFKLASYSYLHNILLIKLVKI